MPRIMTPPRALLPLYRTVSNPDTVGEQSRLLRRHDAARRYRDYEAATDPKTACAAFGFIAIFASLMFLAIKLFVKEEP